MTESTERFRKLGELFDELVSLSPAEREPLIVQRCGGDPALETELRQLLAVDLEDSERFIAGLVEAEAGGLRRSDVKGRELGNWRILQTIGEGGMGTVYLAERADGAYDAKVAIKLVRGGLPSPRLEERFRAERQILAGLSHPGVAKLLDGGSTEDGTPYLVMEFIAGLPITTWCEQRDMDVDGRLRLFVKTCDAVAYAHRELVAHRDLKPNNILVTDDGEPKLLDFGIARLMDSMGDPAAAETRSHWLLTPAYASPERVAGGRAGVGADIYSLGVLLHELLSGRLPLDTSGLTPVELISRVTEDVPASVSSMVDDPALRRRLEGDLDAIVSRALRKEPEARYPTVESLADDVRLHLDGRPIRTRNDDWRYRAGKAIRRNRGMVSTILLGALVGVSFTVNAVLQARALARERDRAEAQSASAQRVSEFLEELFTEADPNEASDLDVTVREILDRGASRVLTELVDQPESRAALATVIGRVYNALGAYDEAEPLLDSALAVRQRQTNGDPTALADALTERGVLAYNVGDYERAVALHSDARSAHERGSGGDSHALAGAILWLAVAHADLGDLEAAERYMREAVDMHRRVDPEPTPGLAVALKGMQDILRDVGKVEEAVVVGWEALTMSRQAFGDDHLETAHALNQMGSSLRDAGRTEEAIPLVEEGLEIRRTAFGGPHVEVAASLGNLANMLAALGRDREAIAPRRESTEMLRLLFSVDHPYTASSTAALGNVLLRADSLEEAESVLGEALQLTRRAYAPGHASTATPLVTLGTLYRRTDRLNQAIRVLEEGHAIRAGALTEGHWLIGTTSLELARAYEAAGRDEEADQHFTVAHELLLAALGLADDRTVEAREGLRTHLLRRGLTDRADQL